MLIVTPIGAGAAGYFLDAPSPGTWVGDGARRLGLGGAVAGDDLRAVLAGRDGDRHPLTPKGRHRRAGWDLTFAAPKGASIVAALAHAVDPTAASALVAAHRGAVDHALGWLTAHGARTRVGGPDRPAEVVAARFDHDHSDAGDPHLHTHVVLANVGATGDADRPWAPLAGPLWPALRPLGGIYRSALVANSAAAGLGVRWLLRADGLVDLAGVPDGAVTAASRRTATVRGRLADFDEPALAGRAARRAMRGASRQPGRGHTETAAGPAGGGRTWSEAVARTGLDAHVAADILRGAPPSRSADAGLVGRASGWLAARSTTFTGFDAARAVTAVATGLAPAEVDAAVAALVGADDPYRAGRRATTPAALQAERRLEAACERPSGVVVPPPLVAEVAAEFGLDTVGAALVDHLVGAPGCAVTLAGAPGVGVAVAQAEALAAARACWESLGWSVGVLATPTAARRWSALGALDAAAATGPPGGARDGAGPRRRSPDVLVVDCADRRSPAELLAIVDEVAHRGGRAVLVDGGSLPARHHPASTSLRALHGVGHPLIGQGADVPERDRPGGVVELDRVGAALTPLGALSHLAARWATWPAGQRPLLVGLGPAEVEALNGAARRARVAAGEVGGPALVAFHRTYQTGDEVVALRAVRDLPAGARGVVAAVGRNDLEVHAAGRRLRLDRQELRRFGLGYAATPGRARAGTGPVLVLGDADAVPLLRRRVVGAARTATVGLRDPDGRLDALARELPDADERHGRAVRAALDVPLDRLTDRRRRLAATLHAALARRHDDSAPPSRAGWAAEHADALVEHRALGRAATLRRGALTTALEGQPWLHRAGPRPGATDLGAWRVGLAARAAELDRDASLPGRRVDQGMGLGR